MKYWNEELKVSDLTSAWTGVASEKPPQGSCLLPEMIWNAARGGLPPRETRRVVDHLSACAACAQSWRLALVLSRQLSAPAFAYPKRRSRRPLWAAAAAATVVLLVGAGILRDPGPASQVVLRQVQTATIQSLLPDGHELSREEFVLQWTPPDGEQNVHYRVTVTTESLQVVASTDGLVEPHYQVPAELLKGLPPGTSLRWQVEAVRANGSRVDSPTFLCRLK